jgi:hypothetical protein
MVECISDAVSETAPAVREMMNQLPGFRDIGKRMLATWSDGIQLLREPRIYAMSEWQSNEAFRGTSDLPKLESPSPVIGRTPLLAIRVRHPKKANEFKTWWARVTPWHHQRTEIWKRRERKIACRVGRVRRHRS